MDWSQAENEVSLFYALRDHRPVGRDRFFHMYFILEQFTSLTKKELTSDVLWDRLREMYDIDALNQNENEAYDANLEVSDFKLPSEYDDLVAKKVQEIDRGQGDKPEREKDKDKDHSKDTEKEKVKEKEKETEKEKDKDDKEREKKKLKSEDSKDGTKEESKIKDEPKKKDETGGTKIKTSSKKPDSLKNPSKTKSDSTGTSKRDEATPIKKKASTPSSPKIPTKKQKR